METRALLLSTALGLALAGSAQAVHLDPGGRGQVLIYPYYTVNNGQQTLLSVTNASAAAQVVKVRFHESYNNREVIGFNLWLGPHDVWTATVFALEDAGLPGEGAAMLTSDRSCTAHLFSSDGLLPDGTPYVWFRNFSFLVPADGGPTSLSRTREGYVEIIAMADVTEPLLSALHPGGSGMPADCAVVQLGSVVAPSSVSTRPSGGLIGTASIINVAQGTLLATRAEALGGFTAVSLYTGPGNIVPNLASVNDDVLGGKATANLFDSEGRAQQLSYGGPGVTTSLPVDAVTAILMADQVYNEYTVSTNLAAGSDWVLTFPTKGFYVDPGRLPVGAMPREPFEWLFQAPGISPVTTFGHRFDRESREWAFVPEDGGIGLPPPSPDPYPGIVGLDWATSVLSFGALGSAGSAVLGSRLATEQIPNPDEAAPAEGWMALDLYGASSSSSSHSMPPSNEGKVLRGLPVIGFSAVNLVNNAVSNGVLSNYSAAVRHATSVKCEKISGGTTSPCD